MMAFRIGVAVLISAAINLALAEGRALLIGVGQYKGHPELTLDGPRHDAEVLAEVLKEWGFSDIKSLVDSAATGAGIRKELKALAARTKAGDQVFLFFSGHGTSAFDPKWARICGDVHSGCLIPHDVEDGDEAAVLRSMILGRRDIRPALLEIEKRQPAGVFVSFDSCYSQNSAKSVLGIDRGKSRETKEAPMSAFLKKGQPKGSAIDDLGDLDPAAYASPASSAAKDEPFPYERVIYLAASARDERAFDIPAAKLADNPTVDKKPHGRFTNALLAGLQGAADLDGNRTVTYEELHQFSVQQLRGVQTPQIQAKSAALMSGPAFGSARKVTRPRRGDRKTVRVMLKEGAAGLRAPIAEMAKLNIEIVTTAPDFVIDAAPGGWSLALENGLEVRRYTRDEASSLLARLKAEPGVRKLMDWNFDKPVTSVDFSFGPERQGVHFLGQQVAFNLSAREPVYFLLVNINTAGGISVIYPSKWQPSAKVTKIQAKAVLEEPSGAEYMKLFAFKESPGNLDRWIGDEPFPAASAAFTELLTMIEKAEGAESGLVFYSAPKPKQ